MDENSIPSLLMAEKKSGIRIRPTQGGYNAGGVTASAGTHDGGAVIDISTTGLSSRQITSLLRWLRLCGWAAWYRTPAQGFIRHIHAVRIGDASAARGARSQVEDYKAGRNGLANRGRDDGPRVGVVTWEASKYNPANAPKPYVINGKEYKPLRTVSVFWINANRATFRATKKTPISRHVHRLQVWLHKGGKGYLKAKPTGRWDAETQAALDEFRSRHLRWPTSDATGPAGISSLTKLKQYGATTDKYDVKEGK